MREKISICLLSYNNEKTILETAKSALAQTFSDFELLVADDASPNGSPAEILSALNDPRLVFFRNEKNLGCGGNLNELVRRSTGDILVFISGDDLLDKHALTKIFAAFQQADDIGIVARPYYWFEGDYKIPLRATEQFEKELIISLNDSPKKVEKVIGLSSQISGMSFRKKFMKGHPFASGSFIEVPAVVIWMLKNCRAVILKDNTVAVRGDSSGSMNYAVYIHSPMLAWINAISGALGEKKYELLKNYLIRECVSINYVGLVQIKNYGSLKFLFREIWYLIKFRPMNLLNVYFWFFSLGTILVPRIILRKMVEIFKKRSARGLSQKIAAIDPGF